VLRAGSGHLLGRIQRHETDAASGRMGATNSGTAKIFPIGP
jgi:hypothetical protein